MSIFFIIQQIVCLSLQTFSVANLPTLNLLYNLIYAVLIYYVLYMRLIILGFTRNFEFYYKLL